MAMYAELFDGTRLEFPDGTDPSVIAATAKKVTLSLPKPEAQPVEGPPVANPQGGFSGALAGSTEQIQADISRLAGKIGLKDTAQAERDARMHEAEAKKVFKPTEQGWTEAPFTKLAETAGGSLPYMAAPVAAGVAALALPEIGLAGGLIGTAELAAGAVGAAQFTGTNLSRQVQEGKTLEEASLLKAGAAAIPQAALDVFGLKMLPGIRQIFNKAGVEASEKALQEVAKKGLLEQTGTYALQTGKTMGAEGLTEAGQAVFERLQAGLNITDEDARKEYFENFIGGAVLGGAFSVPGHAYEAIKGKNPDQVIEESKSDLEKGAAEIKTAPVIAETTQVGAVPEGESHDTQAMVDELAGKDITQPAPITETTPTSAPEINIEPNVTPSKEILFHYTEPKTNQIVSVVMGADNKLVNVDTGKPISIKDTDLIPGPPPANIAPIEKPVSQAKPVEELKVKSDIPNENWLNEQIESTNKYGFKESGAPKFFGKTTGTFTRTVLMPVDELAKIPGENNEQKNVRQGDLKAIKEIMEKSGRLPQSERGGDYKPFILVDQNGKPYVSEGNHRIMAAKELGFKYLPVEIKYFNGGERQQGMLSPDSVIGNDKAAREQGFNEESYRGETTPELPETKSFQIAKPMEQIAAEISKMTKGSQVAQWLIDNAPNTPAREIAKRVLINIKAIEDFGVPVKITVLNGAKRKGHYGSSGGMGPRGQLQYFSVEYNGLNSKGQADVVPDPDLPKGTLTSWTPTGTRYSTLMHELLHVVSQVQLDSLMKRNYKGSDKVIYNDLRSVYRVLKNKIEEDKKNIPRKNWHPLLEEVGINNDKGVLKDIHELLVRSLTEENVQSYLASIKIGKKTALTKLMEVFRKLIGLDPQYQTALDKLITVSDRIFAQKPQDIAKYYSTQGGTFGPKKEEIGQTKNPSEARNYKGKTVQASWSFPEDNIKHWYGLSDEKVDNIIYKLQDKQIDTKRAQQMIEKEVGKIDDDLNVYDKEQLYHGRTATGIREFLLNELMPAIKELQKLGLTPQEMREYLHNRHAQERNEKMNEINKLDPITGKERKTPWELQDRASGIATADAKAYLAGLDPKKKTALKNVADMFDKMVKETQAILVQSGAETQDTIDSWNKTYQHYVPLFRVEEDIGGFGTTGASKGFGTQGKFSKRAMGSEKEVQDILGNLIAQRERALIRSEKIKVGRALYALALKNPNPDLWLPVNPDAIKSKEALTKELMSLGFDNAAEIANNLMEEPKSRYISKTTKKKVDPNTGQTLSDTEESVKLKVDNLARFGDNVFPIRINGKDRYIFFNQKNPNAVRMVQSLKNLDADSLGDIEGVLGRMTRWFASVNTQYNPIFGAVNLLRDVQSAMFNLSTTPLAGMQGKVSSGIIPAMRGIINVLRNERKGIVEDYSEDKWAEAFQDFRKQGGQTGYRESLIRTDEEKAIIEKELDKMKEGNAKKAFGAVMGVLTDFNDMMENSVRVSAYVAALDKGLSKQQAAIIAKNLTVNFDKKGQLSARINAYYAFFNASVQGTARLAQTLKGPMGRKIIAGGIGLGAMQAVMLAAAGYREDEPPEFVRERNFVIPMPDGKYLSIPYPLGLHILPNVGRITTEFVLGGGKHGGKKVANMTGAFMDAFSPVGSSGLSIQSVLPTVLDPIAALESNKDAFGRPIYREDRATNPMPGYMRSRESASEISKNISYFLNLASGGGKYSKGFLSPTADELDYIAGQVTGGVGRELIKTEQAIKAGVTGEELPTYRIPLAGRFIGDTESKAAESQRFYGNITRMADHEHEVKGRQKNKENVMEYYREHPEARFWQMANNVENQINALNKQKKEFQEKGLPKDRIQRIDNQKALIMKRFNDHIAKFEE
jgi:hypothetical protein